MKIWPPAGKVESGRRPVRLNPAVDDSVQLVVAKSWGSVLSAVSSCSPLRSAAARAWSQVFSLVVMSV